MSTELRNNEYYSMQETFDWLYQMSLNNDTYGLDLYDLVISRNNILLAYRNIKSNTGSHTKGTDGLTIDDYKIENAEKFIKDIRLSLLDYKPKTVRRVEIPKPNGKLRPLGIPTMHDRLIQQMYKQILEPICEAKFHKHSYGFRANRSTHNALSRCCHIANMTHNHYVVDLDIESFFDNVNHTKLIKQLWNIGIKDNRVLTIISRMLKAPIKGVLSPLLSNVVLNDLDWWISNQWETFNADYKCPYKYRVLKKTNLKEMYAVRYADDARVFTCSYKNAVRIYHAVKEYLKNELKLNVSPEKSKITNLRKRKSDYFGFEMKLVPKRNKYVVNTFVSAKSKRKIKAEIRKKVIEIQRQTISKNIHNYNSYILGIRNYFEAATHVNIDFRNVYHQTLKTLYNRLKPIAKYEVPRSPPPLYRRLFKNNYRTFTIGPISLFPLADTQWKLKVNFNQNFNQNICNYTQEGRKLVYKRLENNVTSVMKRLLELPIEDGSVEYRDNTISKYSMQKGRCGITQLFLTAEEIHCHHIVPVGDGGTDNFDNLIIIHKEVHKLIHGNNQEIDKTLLKKFNLNKTQLKKLNMLRKRCNLTEIN